MADQSETTHFQDSALVLLIPRGAALRGTVTSTEPQQLLLEGIFNGRIELKGVSRVVIAEGAVVEAESIQAHSVVVHGRVTGHIHAQVLELGPTARVSGSLRYDLAFASQPGARMRVTQIDGPQEEEA